jgi:hypothetical protein
MSETSAAPPHLPVSARRVAMRKLVFAASVCTASVCWAGAPVEPVILAPSVHLNSAADLDRLREANPDHYARAVRLMNAANTLCKPGEPKLQNTDGRDISCGMRLLTSNPPKRALAFTLDNTHYVAIVTITADPPKLIHADLTKSAH